MNPTSIDFSLAGRHSVVCGSTQGIGRAIAEAFAAAGSSVTLVGRNEDGTLIKEFEASHGTVSDLWHAHRA